MPTAPAIVNATAAALLGLLQQGPATGGELVALAQQRHGGYFGLTRSQVYRELPALADAGLLRLGRQGARASQQYVLTAAGRNAFRTWLGQRTGPDTVRSPLLLRLANADQLTAEQRGELVEGARALLAEQLVDARAAVGVADGACARAAAEFAVTHLKAVAKVVDRVGAV